MKGMDRTAPLVGPKGPGGAGGRRPAGCGMSGSERLGAAWAVAAFRGMSEHVEAFAGSKMRGAVNAVAVGHE